MINKYISTVLIATVFAVGCSPDVDDDNTEIQTGANQIGESSEDMFSDLNDYSFDRKSDFMTTMNQQQAEIDKQIRELSVKIEQASDAVKTETRSRLAALREHSSELSKQIDEIAEATPSTWESIKANSQKAYMTVKDAVVESDQWFNERV